MEAKCEKDKPRKLRSFLVEDILGFDKNESKKDGCYDAEINRHHMDKRIKSYQEEEDSCTKYRGQGHCTENSKDISREEMDWQG